MKIVASVLAVLFTAVETPAQKPVANEFLLIDKLALKLPDSLARNSQEIAEYITANFKTENEKARAAFIWVASNIQYDVENMYALNFYETSEQKIAKPLRSRKGICENYAALFTDICSKVGIKSYVVDGYTRQNGANDYLPHAWSAARLDNTWFLFDPTWGSGSVTGGKFYKKINNQYFKVSPQEFIKTHMPFDYLWQFLNYPVNNQEFTEGRVQPNPSKPKFEFVDSLETFDKQSHIEQVTGSAYRVERNGAKNSLVFDRLQHLQLEIEQDKQYRVVGLYNAAVASYNDGISHFNHFINYRNRQFTPQKSDTEIQAMIDSAANKLNQAKLKLAEIKNPETNAAQSIAQLSKGIEEASKQVNEQQEWLKVYFSKGKAGRKRMFYEKITLFGKPIN